MAMTLIQTVDMSSTPLILSSIPTGYTHLYAVMNIRQNYSGAYPENFLFRFNSNTNSEYYMTANFMQSTSFNTNATNARTATDRIGGGSDIVPGNGTTNNFMAMSVYILNYRSTNAKKVLVKYATGPTDDFRIGSTVGSFVSASPITSWNIQTNNNSSFATGSTVSLYGLV
jgi:hypothetical protein